MQIVIDIAEDMIKSLEQGNFGAKYNIYDLVGTLMNGTPLPDGAEILTKEAYSDLCTRAADVPGTNVGELISRQAVLDLVANYDLSMGEVVRGIHDLPSFTPQPEKRTEECTETHACDCISRKAAIDAFEKFIHELGIKDEPYNYGEMALSVQNVPSIEPERKPGKWLLKIEDWNRWTCSECGFSTRTDIHVTLGYDYCPKCGAPMEVNG